MDNELRSIPIILFTACVIDEIARMVKARGPIDLMLKTFSPGDLMKKPRKIAG